jgi:heme-degrading monooxygenase HmoA
MIVEYIRYMIPAGHQAEFIRDYSAAREPLMRSPYALDFEISQCAEDGAQFIVRIEWTSADDHLKKFRTSAEFREFFTHISPYVSMIEEMRHYEPR